MPVRPSPRPVHEWNLKTAVLEDTIIRDGREYRVSSTRPKCAHLGAKKLIAGELPLMAKAQGCKNTATNIQPIIYTPVYECAEFRRCAPFAAKIDDEFDPTHPCIGCRSYQRPAPANN